MAKEKTIVRIVLSNGEYMIELNGTLNETMGCVPILKAIAKEIEITTRKAVRNNLELVSNDSPEDDDEYEDADANEHVQQILERNKKTYLRYIG